MKAQFKYTFLSSLYVRGSVFAVIFVMNTVFIILGSLDLLPFAAHVTAVSLGGVAIAVMIAANVIDDVAICRRMFSAPSAYLYALVPVPRWKILLTSIIAMTVMDCITMTFVIISEVWLSFNLVGKGIWQIAVTFFNQNPSGLFYIVWGFLLLLAFYLLGMLIILFCITAKKSVFYKKPASGLLAFLLACGCVYAASLLQLILAPFAVIQRYGIFIILTFGSNMALFYIVLTLLEATALFGVTSKLMEKRMNI